MGGGSFSTPVSYPNIGAVQIANLTADGKPDRVASDRQGDVFVLRNDGNGGFPVELASPPPLPSVDRLVAAGDVNLDGIVDLITVGYETDLQLGFGGAVFVLNPGPSISNSTGLEWPVIADLNGDGHPDFVGKSATDSRNFSSGLVV